MSMVKCGHTQHQVGDPGIDLLTQPLCYFLRRAKNSVFIDIKARAIVAMQKLHQVVACPCPIVIDSDIEQTSGHQSARVLPYLTRSFLCNLPATPEIPDCSERRHDPAISQGASTTDRRFGDSTDKNWHWCRWPYRGLTELKKLTRVIDWLPTKQLPQYRHALTEHCHAPVHWDAQAIVFLGTTAQRNPQGKPPTAQMVQRRDLPCDNGRQTQVQHQHGRAQNQVSRMSRCPQQEQQGVRQRGRMKYTIFYPERVEAGSFDLLKKFCISLAALQPRNRDTRHMDTDRYRPVHNIPSSKGSTNLTRSILNQTIFKLRQHLIKRAK